MTLYRLKYKLTKTGKLDTHENTLNKAERRIVDALAITHGDNIKVKFLGSAKADYGKPGKIKWVKVKK
jgi:hypothetical protein